MMRRSLLAIALVALCAGAARAQDVEWYLPSDSALTALTGDTGTVRLDVYNGTYNVGVSGYRITIFLDDARIRLVRADSVAGYGMPSPTITTGSGQVTLSAYGTGSTALYTMPLATLYFEMDSLATTGSLLSVRVDTLVAGDGTTNLVPTHTTHVLNACQAEEMWGDLDGGRTISSRDALIAITAAVGLPVAGYDVTVGDVDEDAATTTRDALYILSAGIGLATYTRVGEPRANACAPLEPVPNDVAFWDGSALYWIPAGDTIPQAVGVTGTTNYTSWAPDGSRILIEQYIGSPNYGDDLVAVAPDGSTADTLFLSTSYEYQPAWSPDGTRVAFVSYRTSNYALYLANADGTNQVQLSGDSLSLDSGSRIDWRPDGSQIVMSAYNRNTGSPYGLWVANTDGSGEAPLPLPVGSSATAARDPRWSPQGDSLVYDYSNVGRIYAAAPSDTLGRRATFDYNSQDYPLWVAVGIAWLSGADGLYYLRRASDRRVLRLSSQAGPFRAAARRVTRYVQTVTVAPWSPVGVDYTNTMSATVLDDQGNPITPGSGIQWSSSDPSIVSIDPATGLATALASGGPVTITASAGGWRQGTTSVTVP